MGERTTASKRGRKKSLSNQTPPKRENNLPGRAENSVWCETDQCHQPHRLSKLVFIRVSHTITDGRTEKPFYRCHDILKDYVKLISFLYSSGLVIVSATVPDRALLLPGAAAGPAAEPLLLLELILSWRGSDAHDMVTRKFWVKDGEISLRDDEVCCRRLF